MRRSRRIRRPPTPLLSWTPSRSGTGPRSPLPPAAGEGLPFEALEEDSPSPDAVAPLDPVALRDRPALTPDFSRLVFSMELPCRRPTPELWADLPSGSTRRPNPVGASAISILRSHSPALLVPSSSFSYSSSWMCYPPFSLSGSSSKWTKSITKQLSSIFYSYFLNL